MLIWSSSRIRRVMRHSSIKVELTGSPTSTKSTSKRNATDEHVSPVLRGVSNVAKTRSLINLTMSRSVCADAKLSQSRNPGRRSGKRSFSED